MNRFLLLIIIAFASCKSNTKELAIHDFMENVFLVEQETNNYGESFWQPKLNRGIREVDRYYGFFVENEAVLSYMKWNLFLEKLPDSIKYSSKSYDEVQQDFQKFATQDKEIQNAIQLLIYPEQFTDENQITMDSLLQLSAKLFTASSIGEGKISWNLCTGKSKFQEIFGKSKNFQTIALQSLCFQVVSEELYNKKEQSLWDAFEKNISEVSAEMQHIEYYDYEKKANQLMWQKMAASKELRNALDGFTRLERSKLYFEVIHN